MKIDYYQKLYAFYVNCEYHLITRISKKYYGVVPLFTDSYGIEGVKSETLEGVIELCINNRWDVKEFKTYKDLFEWFMEHETDMRFYDFWNVQNVTGRHFYIEDVANPERIKKENKII